MAETPEIAVRFRADGADAVASAVKQLANELGDLKKRQVEAAESSLTLGKAISGLIGIETIRRLVDFGKEIASNVIQTGRLSQETGVTVKTLSALQVAGAAVGVTHEQMSTGLVRLSRNIVELQGGSTKAATAFDRIGLSAKSFVGLSVDQKVLKVFDAIGKLQAGNVKAAESQALLGRGGAALIPVMNELAEAGLGTLIQRASDLGKLLDDETVASFMATAGAMQELKEKAEGIGQAFETGMMPGVADAADELVRGTSNGADGFKTLGEWAGDAIRLVIVGMEELGMDIALVVNSSIAAFESLWATIKTGGTAVFEAFADAATGNFAKAWKDLSEGWTTTKNLVQDGIEDQNRMWDENVAQKKAIEDRMFDPTAQKSRQEERAKKFRESLGQGGADSSVADKTGQSARIDGLRQALEQELKAYKDETKLELQEQKNKYDQGLISQADYFAARRTAIQQDLSAEIVTLQSQRGLLETAPAKNAQEAETNKQKILAINEKIHTAEVAAALQNKTLDGEEFAAKEKNAKTLLDFQVQILEAEGKTFDAAILKIAQEGTEARRALVQAGMNPEQANATVGTLTNQKTTDARFSELGKEGSQVLAQFEVDRQAITNDATRGLISEYGAEQKILELERERIGTLRDIADAQLAEAQLSGDSAKILQAEQFKTQIESMSAAIEEASRNWRTFVVGVEQGVTSDLANFLDSGIDHVTGLKDAFAQLGTAALQTIRKIATEMLVQMAVSKAFDWLRSKFGGGTTSTGTQIAQAAATGAAQAAPLLAASFSLDGAGAMIITGAGALAISAAELMAAAMQLTVANSIRAGVGFSGGGFVRGAGSSTSDSIAARLSDGEFVVRAAAVRAVGVHTLAAINRGLRIPPVSLGYIPRFADGGLVQADTNAGGEIRMHIGLERGLILQEFESKAGAKIVLRHAQENAKTFQKAISRG